MKYKWCKTCQINYLRKNFANWTSENETIDNFIQNKQLEINDPSDIIFEWIFYNQLFDTKEIDGNYFSTVYSAKWKNGPLHWDENNREYTKNLDKEVALEYLHHLQDIDEFLNKVNFFIMFIF
jgi:hypothetical protein